MDVRFSKKYTGHFLLKYYAFEIEGAAYVEITEEMKQKLRMMKTLLDISAGIVDVHSVSAFYEFKTPIYFLTPKLKAEHICKELWFVQEYEGIGLYWDIQPTEISPSIVVPAEILLMEATHDNVSFVAYPYTHSGITHRIHTVGIKYQDLGIN